MAKHEMDKHSAEYLKYLRNRNDLERQMLLERAEVDEQELTASIKARSKALRDLDDKHANFGEPGTGRIVPLPGEIIPPFGVPVPGWMDIAVCNFKQTLNIEDADYVVLDSDPHSAHRAVPPKTAFAEAGGGTGQVDTSGLIHVGYVTKINVPAAGGATAVNITSILNADFSWVEANSLASGGIAHVSARGHAWLAGAAGFQPAPAVPLVNSSAEGGNRVSHLEMPTTEFWAIFELSGSVPGGSGATLHVYETVTLNAVSLTTQAFIKGKFTWEPLKVTMSEGCKPMRLPRWGYWGRV